MFGVFRGRLWDNLGTALLALVLAVIVWVNAISQSDPPVQDVFGEPIPIEVLNASPDLTITSEMTTEVKVSIKAFQSSWGSLTRNNLRATIDLEDLGEGLHAVPVEVTCSNPTVTIVSSQPDTLYVQLEPAKRIEMDVTLQIDGQADVPLGYAVGTAGVEPARVTVEGPTSMVDKVASVVAQVDLADKRQSVDAEVALKALDTDGKQIASVTLTPGKVQVRVPIEQRQNYREVAVLGRTTGQPARGYYVSSLEVEPATVTVVGSPSIIASMPGLVQTKQEVDVTGATRMIAERSELALPDGVEVYSSDGSDPRTVLVTVDIDAVMGGTTVELPLKARKLKEGYTVSLSVPSVDVILTGPAVVLDDLAIDLLDAYVDLSGLEVGTHQAKVVVEMALAQNPQLADLAVTSVSPAFVEADIKPLPATLPAPPTSGTPAAPAGS